VNDTFIRNRITELRLKKGVSEYRMSTDMGHSKSYIQSITSGRALPSLMEFLYICEYFCITPRDFFDDGQKYPALLKEAIDGLKELSEDDIALTLSNIMRLRKK